MTRFQVFLSLFLFPGIGICQTNADFAAILKAVSNHYYQRKGEIQYSLNIKYVSDKEDIIEVSNCWICGSNYIVEMGKVTNINNSDFSLYIDENQKLIVLGKNDPSRQNPLVITNELTKNIDKFNSRKIYASKSLMVYRIYSLEHNAGEIDSIDLHINILDYSIKKIINFYNPEYDFMNNDFGPKVKVEISFVKESYIPNAKCNDAKYFGYPFLKRDNQNKLIVTEKYKSYQFYDANNLQ